MSKVSEIKTDKFTRINSNFSFPANNANDNIVSPSDNRSTSNDQQSDTQSINNDNNEYKIDLSLLVRLVPTLSNMLAIGQFFRDNGTDLYDKIDIELTVRKAVQLAVKPNGEKLNEKDFEELKENMASFVDFSGMLNLEDANVPTPKILSRRNSVSSLDRNNKNAAEQLDPITEEQAEDALLAPKDLEHALKRLSDISIEQRPTQNLEERNIIENQGVDINFSNENDSTYGSSETNLLGKDFDSNL